MYGDMKSVEKRTPEMARFMGLRVRLWRWQRIFSQFGASGNDIFARQKLLKAVGRRWNLELESWFVKAGNRPAVAAVSRHLRKILAT